MIKGSYGFLADYLPEATAKAIMPDQRSDKGHAMALKSTDCERNARDWVLSRSRGQSVTLTEAHF